MMSWCFRQSTGQRPSGRTPSFSFLIILLRVHAEGDVSPYDLEHLVDLPPAFDHTSSSSRGSDDEAEPALPQDLLPLSYKYQQSDVSCTSSSVDAQSRCRQFHITGATVHEALTSHTGSVYESARGYQYHRTLGNFVVVGTTSRGLQLFYLSLQRPNVLYFSRSLPSGYVTRYCRYRPKIPQPVRLLSAGVQCRDWPRQETEISSHSRGPSLQESLRTWVSRTAGRDIVSNDHVPRE
ncbi:hypothetical protein SAMN05216564_11810 [Halopenitus persicus]|uniref:Uncharacterized protein n=1 Tax=Halopenitus persicus TaxID=1048396 RepID=A0A1H3P266_9EURY|nr:hypothetical protein SAMN05216564_11810 [Halopenitus persicus]